MLSDQKWDSLQTRRGKARLVMFYRATHGLVDIPLPKDLLPLPFVFRLLHFKHATFRIQHATFCIQHATFRIQHATFCIQHATFRIRLHLTSYRNPGKDDIVGATLSP